MAEGRSPTDAKVTENPTPALESEPSPFTVDIKEIATNVKYKMIGLYMEKEGSVKDIFNWKETPDLGDAWFDHNKELRKYAYYGEKPRNLKRPFRDFLKHVLGFHRIRGSEELEAAEADIQRTIARHGNRRIEIYNISAVLAYLSAARGVSVDPDCLTYYLNCKKIRSEGNTFQSTRKNYKERITLKVAILEAAYKAFSKLINQTIEYFGKVLAIQDESVVRDMKGLVVINDKRKTVLKLFTQRIRTLKKKYDDFGTSFWDVQIVGNDANEYLFDFLLAYIPKLCKLNPTPTGEKPTL